MTKAELEERLISQLLLKSQIMVSSVHQLAQSSQNEVVKAQQNASWIVIFLVIIIVALVVTSSWALGRGVMGPIAKLKEGAIMVGSGKLDYQIDITANDEIGELSRTFNQMTATLNKHTTELQ